MIKKILDPLIRGIAVGVLMGTLMTNIIMMDRYKNTVQYFNEYANNVLLLLDVMQTDLEWTNRKMTSVVKKVPELMDVYNECNAKQDMDISGLVEMYRTLGAELASYHEEYDFDYEGTKESVALINNMSKGVIGTGTNIRIGNKYYILTCWHVIENLDAMIEVRYNKDPFGTDTIDYPATPLKIDRWNDLALLKLFHVPEHYEVIADVEPEVGDMIYVLGYPHGNADVLTRGIVSKTKPHEYQLQARVFPGNSGSAVFYQGKIVGVVRTLSYSWNLGVTHGASCTLGDLKHFLKEYTNE